MIAAVVKPFLQSRSVEHFKEVYTVDTIQVIHNQHSFTGALVPACLQRVKKPWMSGQAVLDILILDLQVKVSSFRREKLKLYEKGGDGLPEWFCGFNVCPNTIIIA